MLQSYLLSRRALLRGIGVSLALPSLEIMTRAVSAGPTPRPPVRLGVLFKGNGVHPPSWDIAGTGEANFELSPLLEPLRPVRDKVLILSNLELPQGGGSHHASAVAFLAAAETPGSVDVRQPVTMDQFAAARVGQHTAVRSLELSVDGLFLPQPRCSYISYGEDGRPVPRENDPQIVFDRLFRGRGSEQRQARTRSILDAVQEDARSLRRSVSNADQRTLDSYFEAVREVERTIEKTQTPAQPGRVPNRAGPHLERPGVPRNFPDRVRAMLDLMVLAFWTDSTRIVSFMMGNENSRLVFDFLGIDEEHHYLSHFVRHPEVDFIRKFNNITRWHVTQFAYLIDRLARIREGEGTLLDHSMLLFGCGLKHSDYHTNSDIPIVLAGGGGGTLNTGRRVRYQEPQPFANLHLSLLRRLGVETPRFGASTGTLAGLERPLGNSAAVADDGRWTVTYDSDRQLTVRGLLRQSDVLDEINIYYVQLSNGRRIKIQAPFGNLNNTRLDEFCGSVVTLVGNYTRRNEEAVVQEVTRVRR